MCVFYGCLDLRMSQIYRYIIFIISSVTYYTGQNSFCMKLPRKKKCSTSSWPPSLHYTIPSLNQESTYSQRRYAYRSSHTQQLLQHKERRYLSLDPPQTLPEHLSNWEPHISVLQLFQRLLPLCWVGTRKWIRWRKNKETFFITQYNAVSMKKNYSKDAEQCSDDMWSSSSSPNTKKVNFRKRPAYLTLFQFYPHSLLYGENSVENMWFYIILTNLIC